MACTRGFPRNLRDPDRLRHGAVALSEGNEATREGHGKSERLVVPTKQGNLANGTLWREGAATIRNRLEER